MATRRLFGAVYQAHKNYLFFLSSQGLHQSACAYAFKAHTRHTLIELQKRKEKYEFGKPQAAVPRSSFLEWNYEAELFSFGKRIKEDVDSTLLMQALTQRSFIIQEEERQKSVGMETPLINVTENTPLVEPGRVFLSQFVKQYLRVVLPYFPEEGIQSVHDYLTSEDTISHIAQNIGMGDIVQTSEYPPEKSSLQDCFHALIQVIRLSSNDHRASNFIRDLVITQLASRNVNDLWQIEDPVAKLNNIYKNHAEELPEARIVGTAGKNTLMANYRIAFYNKDKDMIGLGFGESIEIAKDMAAVDALRRLFKTSDRDAPIRYDLDINVDNQQSSNVSILEWSESKLLLKATG